MLIHSDTYKNWYLDPAKPHNVGVIEYTSSNHNKANFHKHKAYKTPWLKKSRTLTGF